MEQSQSFQQLLAQAEKHLARANAAWGTQNFEETAVEAKQLLSTVSRLNMRATAMLMARRDMDGH